MRLTRASAVIAGTLFAAPALAQPTTPAPPTMQPGTGLIVGQVVDGATGKGVAGAVVTIANARRVLATNDGRFVFRDLPPGRHTLTASKGGYIDGAFGSRTPGGTPLPLVLERAERRAGVIIRLWRHGTISGTIVDEMGEPLIGIQVSAIRRSTVAGRRRLAPAGMAATDDRGIYRIPRLSPGDYVVGVISTQVSVPAAMARQFEDSMLLGANDASRALLLRSIAEIGAIGAVGGGPNGRQVGDDVQTISMQAPTPPPIDGPRVFAYPATYFPASRSATEARIVTVGSGQERDGIDVQVKPVPTVRVSGTIVGSGSPSGLAVRLLDASAQDAGRSGDVAGTMSDANGGFRFVAVPSGDYSLRVVQAPPAGSSGGVTTFQAAGNVFTTPLGPPPDRPPTPTEPTLWASIPVSVGDADVTDVNVVLRQGVRISGRVEFTGAATPPTPDQLTRTILLVEPLSGQLERMTTPPARVDARGQFTTVGVPGGKYVLRVGASPPGWMVKGAMLGDRDISETPIDLESGDVTGVVLVFTDRLAALSGTVQATEAALRDGAMVVVFPAESKAWTEGVVGSRRLRRVTATEAGTYTVAGLPAGAYYVAAIPDMSTDWMDPAFLESLVPIATHVQVEDAEQATQNLRLQEVRR
jgi:hypothetical protein